RARDGIHLPVRAGHRLGLHRSLTLERMRLVGVAVVPVQAPVQGGCAGGTRQQQPETTFIAHEAATRNQRVMASTMVPVVSAASSSFHCCTGTLPMVSPVRPLTAM